MAPLTFVYGFTIWYRPVAEFLVGDVPDERPIDRLPQLSSSAESTTPEAREAYLARTVAEMEEPRQGYRVEQVERWRGCGLCLGRGYLRVPPKGWRRKRSPAWFLLRQVPCQCGTDGWEIESVTTLSQRFPK